MTNDHSTIAAYVHEFASYLIGSSEDRARAKAELAEHLTDAAEAGELREALERLGTPERAAAAFARERPLPPAPMDDRLVAVAIDNLPLIGLTVALAVQQIMQGTGTVNIMFPPFVYVLIGSACVALVPIVVIGQCEVYNGSLLYALGMPLALLWSIVGLGILESRTGTTPGKRMMGLWVTNEKGIRIKPSAGIIRRLSFLAGPLAWVDWIPVLWGERRRALDRMVDTKVVTIASLDRAQKTKEPSEAKNA